MGNQSVKKSDQAEMFFPEFSDSPTKDDFEALATIGHGSFGNVLLCEHRETGVKYAMKVLKKKDVVEKNAVGYAKAESALQGTLGAHQFIVNLRFAFQSKKKLYLVLDYVGGGDLAFHLSELGSFSEEQSRLYAAEICVALRFLHSHKVVYRDLKLENVLVDHMGHIRLTDFGLAKKLVQGSVFAQPIKAKTFCGTSEYMAPEIILKNDERYGTDGYDEMVDWWQYGVLNYAMVAAAMPFVHENRAALYDLIVETEPEYDEDGWGEATCDFLRSLLTKDPTERLGGDLVADHDYFADLDWDTVCAKGYDPVFVPEVGVHPLQPGLATLNRFDGEANTHLYGFNNFSFVNEPGGEAAVGKDGDIDRLDADFAHVSTTSSSSSSSRSSSSSSSSVAELS